MRVVSLCERLGDVVQHRSPAQPQILGAERDVIEHFQRMFEVVLVGMAAAALDARETVHLGEYQLQQPRQLQQLEAYRRHGRSHYLVELDDYALARDDRYALAVAAYGLERLVVDVEAELRGEPYRTHHAQRVVGECYVGIARGAYGALFEIVHAVEGVDQPAECRGVERPRHSVDREVAAALVVFKRTRLDLRLARIVRIRFAACADELHLGALPAQHRRTECLEYRHLGAQLAPQILGHGNAVANHHYIDIGRGAAQIVVAHESANDIGLHAEAVYRLAYMPENGVIQRCRYHRLSGHKDATALPRPYIRRRADAVRRWYSARRAGLARRPETHRRRYRALRARRMHARSWR